MSTPAPLEGPDHRPGNPPPLTVAASLTAVQGGLLVLLALLEIAHLSSQRMSMGVTTSVFFGVYGVAMVGCALALTRRQGWARGPVLLTQLIQLGLAWNLREFWPVAIVMAATALVVIAGMVHPATTDVLADDPTGERGATEE
ncbi:hypothetical protein [Nocardioides psychrotolerans]|uniref:hypothetical protein n=1 Tax=Nocardioides psychrotolerans TaxID=1005945 RepID=UPI000B873F7A|nr:hypothetical protein [Nocardioides psychrotolerans]